MVRDNLTRLAVVAVAYCLMGCARADPEDSVEKAVHDLSSDETSVRIRAAFTLANTPDKMPELAPILEKRFNEPDDRVRIWMVSAFMHHATEKKKVLPMLVDMLKSPHDSVRSSAASGIRALGTDASSAAPALAKAMTEDASPYVRREAAISLSEIKPDPDAVIPALVAALREEETDVPIFAAEALGKLGAQGKPAVPALLEVLNNPKSDPLVLCGAARGLGGIGASSESAVPVLIGLIGHKDLGVRRAAITAIGKIGRDPDLSIPALAKALENPDLRVHAAIALGRFAPHEEAKRALEAFRNDPDAKIRAVIQDELDKFGPK